MVNPLEEEIYKFCSIPDYGYNKIELDVSPEKLAADMKPICLIANSIEKISNPLDAAAKALKLTTKYPLSRFLAETEFHPDSTIYDDKSFLGMEQSIAQSVEKSVSASIICCTPKCPNLAILNSHTLQKNKVLKSISSPNGLLYQTKITPFAQSTLKEINIKSASSFPGFCRECETKLFVKAENGNTEVNKENILILTWRALCFIKYRRAQELKHRGLMVSLPKVYQLLKDHNAPGMGLSLMLQFKIAIYSFRNAAYWEKVLQDEIFNKKSDLSILAFEIPNTPLVGAGYIPLPINLNGIVNKNVGNFYKMIPGLSFTTLISGRSAYIAFVYKKNDIETVNFLNRLRSFDNDTISAYFPQIVIGGSDTVYISKSFWETEANLLEKRIVLHSQGMKFPQMIYPFWGRINSLIINRTIEVIT